MSVLLDASNMICAVLRKNEAMATSALGGNGASQAGDRGGPGPGQFNSSKSASGPPPPSSPASSPASGPYQFQQQAPPVSHERIVELYELWACDGCTYATKRWTRKVLLCRVGCSV